MENLFRDDIKKAKKRKKAPKATLSFAMDDEEGGEREPPEPSRDSSARRSASKDDEDLDEDERAAKRGKFRKNPNVDTSFLPDREREEAERKERERLRQEWIRKQEDMKQEDIEITYSFWDGSGHRKSVVVSWSLVYHSFSGLTNSLYVQILPREQCKKGDSISAFLEKCRQQFPELRAVSVDNLMYIKVCTCLRSSLSSHQSHIFRRILSYPM